LADGKATLDGFDVKALILQLDPDDDEAEQVARMEVERRATNDVRRALSEQAEDLMPDSASDVAAMAGRVDETSETVSDALRRALVASSDLGVQIAVRQMENVGLSFDWTLANIAARDWANQYTGELVTGINNTTRRTIQQSVAAWIDNGDPLDALVKELEPLFGRERAEMISSTEVTKAFARANQVAYRESGVVDRLEWRVAADERVCPLCAPLEGQRTSIDGNFDGVGLPPRHPRCRCWITPVIDD